MSDEDKPFVCSQPGCGMQFTNEDHLAVHLRKHDMSLALNLTQGGLSPLGLFTDQTPTPTKFLKNCEELGLFQELSKNPFDDSFKKAMDDPIDHVSHGLHLPGTYCADLDTPQPPIPKIVIGGEELHENRKHQDKPKDLTMSSIVPKKRKKFLSQSMPTSTTSEDEEEAVIGSSSTELNGSSENIVTNSVPVEVSSSIPVKSPQSVTEVAENLQSPQNVSQMAESFQSPQSVGQMAENFRSPQSVGQMTESFRSPQSVGQMSENFQSPQSVGQMAENFHSPQNVSQMVENSPVSVDEPIYTAQRISSTGNDSVLTEDDNVYTNSVPVISNQKADSINITSVPISSIPVQNKPALTANPLMVQVLLQLPGGQIVPVQVPASNVATSQQMVQKPQQIQLVRPAIQPQPAVTNLTQNSPTMFLAGNTLFQTGQNIQTVNPGGLIQNNVPFTVKSPQQTNNAQTGLQAVLNQSATHPTLQSVLTQSGSQHALQTILNQSATGSAFQTAAQTALRTILVSNKNTGVQTPAQNHTAQVLQNSVAVNQTNSKPPQKVTIPGSQSYTKQRLKAAIQQQTTPSSNQKQFQVGEIKTEPQWSPGGVSSTATVSSPEAGLSPGTSMFNDSFTGEHSASEGTDVEQKREKFLERNRAAAARCRQKRKHWVQTLERKSDDLSSVNNKLCGEIKKLRGEVASLKTLLLAHKDCPVTMQQRAQGQLGSEMSLDSDLNDVTPINIEDYTEMQTVSEDSAASNHLHTITTVNQSGSSLPVPVELVQNLHGDQVVIKPISVITGSNSLGLIPKIINLDQSGQKTSSGS